MLKSASALLRNIQNIRICMGEKPIVSVTYENERISMKNSLPTSPLCDRVAWVSGVSGEKGKDGSEKGREVKEQSLAPVDTIGKQRKQETVFHPECG